MLSIEFNEGPQDPRRLATEMFGALLSALGEGTHFLLCAVPTPEGTLCGSTVIALDGEEVTTVLDECASFCVALAVGVSPAMCGGVVARTVMDDGSDVVRGWKLADGWAQALNAAEVFDAYCTDRETGEPVPPEPGVDYRAGIPLPHPLNG